MNVAFKGPHAPGPSLDALAEALLLPSGIDGVYACTALFEEVIHSLAAFISRHRELGMEALRFPPVMSRRQLEMSEHMRGAPPHLPGCVCCLQTPEIEGQIGINSAAKREDWTTDLSATDLVLTPTASYPVYPLVASRGDVPATGLLFDVAGECFRREPSRDLDRLQSFRMREFVCVGAAEHVGDFCRRWTTQAGVLAGQLGLPHRLDQASDSFCGCLDASALADRGLAKFELLVPVHSAERSTACISFNDHGDHFGTIWNLRGASGQTMHTGCVAFGMERLALAMFAAHGLDLAVWPSDVRQALAM